MIAKAIAKEPEARFASVSELSDALESIARGEPYQISSPASDLLVSPDNPELVKAQAVTILSLKTQIHCHRTPPYLLRQPRRPVGNQDPELAEISI